MYLAKTPLIVQSLFRNLIWRIKNSDKVYLTFDDGPIPEATPWVLDTLAEYNIKATFFCVGENVEKYPEIYQRILSEGHSVGNHTHNHISGWKTSKEEYLENTAKATNGIKSKLFRPPYGRINRGAMSTLSKEYDIIMWDVLSGDFDSNIDAKTCFNNVAKNANSGSIIVFHDSVKAIEKLKIVLPQVIDFFKKQDIQMDKIED